MYGVYNNNMKSEIWGMALIGNGRVELFELCLKSREKRVNSIIPNDYFESYCYSLSIHLFTGREPNIMYRDIIRLKWVLLLHIMPNVSYFVTRL